MAKSILRSLDLGSVAKITNSPTPTAAGDVANKSYVDAAVQGLGWKEPVRAATTVAGTLATSFAAGQVVDGVTLATGNRILLKNQASALENGIRIVGAGTPARAADADSDTDLQGAAVLVEEGTVNAGTVWTMATDLPIVVDTTALSWIKFGNATALSRYIQTIGDGVATSIALVHNLGTTDVVVALYRATGSFDEVECEVQHTSSTTVTLIFETAPANNAYKAVVIG